VRRQSSKTAKGGRGFRPPFFVAVINGLRVEDDHRKDAAGSVLAIGLAACSSLNPTREQIVAAPAHCVDQTVQIYFEQFSADIPQEGRAVIAAPPRPPAPAA